MKNQTFLKYVISVVFSFFLITPSFVHAFRFVVYGDSRAAPGDTASFNSAMLGAINTKIAALTPQPSFVFFLGDCVRPAWTTNYGRNNLADWKTFMKEGLGKIPFYVAVGNNDLYGNTGWTEFPLQTEFQATFDSMPSNGPHHYKKLAYSFEHGKDKKKSLFIMLDSFGFYTQNGSLVNFDNGIDKEQLDWVSKKARKSNANYKFVLSHGPAFSIEGWPVGSSIRQVWDIMVQHDFDEFYCAHEHIFSRWDITKKIYPAAKKVIPQLIVGSAGSPLDDISLVKVPFRQAHIYRGYTFTVVDIYPHKMVQKSYGVVQNGNTYSTHLIDHLTIRK